MRKGISVVLLALSATVAARAQVQEGPAETTALISVDAKGANPPVNASTLKLQVNGHDTAIDTVNQVRPQGLEVAILIDDGARRSLSLQLKDIETMIHELPDGAKVMVGYMQNGTVRSSHGFTTNHELVAGDLRLPLSTPGISASPYFCLSDFVKHWPSQERAARVVLMITNGVDLYNGSTSITNQNSPYVQNAQEDAQRAGVAVYPLFYGDAGIGGLRSNFSGSSYLQQVADATGGESLYNGTITPVNLKPFLDLFLKRLSESYVIGFQTSATRSKHDTLTRIKVRSTVPGVKVRAPDNVHAGIED